MTHGGDCMTAAQVVSPLDSSPRLFSTSTPHHLAHFKAQAQKQEKEKVMRIEMGPDGSLIYREVEPDEGSGSGSGDQSPL